MKQFNKRVFSLRAQGVKTAVGMAGNMYKRRTYAIVVVDSARRVVAAERLSGWTVFARPQPLPQIVGCALEDLQSPNPRAGISAKLWKAIQHAAGFLVRGFANDEEAEVEEAALEQAHGPKVSSPNNEIKDTIKKGGKRGQKVEIRGYNVR